MEIKAQVRKSANPEGGKITVKSKMNGKSADLKNGKIYRRRRKDRFHCPHPPSLGGANYLTHPQDVRAMFT